VPKDVHLDGSVPIHLRTRLEEIAPKKRSSAEAPFPEVSGDVKTNVLQAVETEPQSSAIHVRMKEMIAGSLGFVGDIRRALDRFGQQLADALAPIFEPAQELVPVYAGVGGRAFPIQRETTGSPVILMMAKIRDMITGSLAREVPGQWLDAEYDDVVKAAKQGDASAKKAKKIAEQGDRLREKIKNKGR
jgi:hypothetical protein